MKKEVCETGKCNITPSDKKGLHGSRNWGNTKITEFDEKEKIKVKKPIPVNIKEV